MRSAASDCSGTVRYVAALTRNRPWAAQRIRACCSSAETFAEEQRLDGLYARLRYEGVRNSAFEASFRIRDLHLPARPAGRKRRRRGCLEIRQPPLSPGSVVY